MCTFDAPISRCEAMRVMVITDQTQRQCAEENGCPDALRCPLADCFTGAEIAVPPPRVSHHRRADHAALLAA